MLIYKVVSHSMLILSFVSLRGCKDRNYICENGIIMIKIYSKSFTIYGQD